MKQVHATQKNSSNTGNWRRFFGNFFMILFFFFSEYVLFWTKTSMLKLSDFKIWSKIKCNEIFTVISLHGSYEQEEDGECGLNTHAGHFFYDDLRLLCRVLSFYCVDQICEYNCYKNIKLPNA